MQAVAETGQRKALFILLDGIPADVIESTKTPNLDAISRVGAYTRSYVGGRKGTKSESPTVSGVSYQSLLTGTWADKHNVWTNEIKQPNYAYWDIFRIAKHSNPTLRTAVFSTWEDNRTKLIGDGLPAAGGQKIDYAADGYENDAERFPKDLMSKYISRIDAHVTEQAIKHIREVGPDLSWVYLQYTDDIGHFFGDGERFTSSVERADGHIGEIYAAVRARQHAHGEDWLLVVTTDHGRDAKSGRGHGGQSERERTTWIVTNSQRLNDRFRDSPPIVDILPSIATHLELKIPAQVRDQLDGQSFIDSDG